MLNQKAKEALKQCIYSFEKIVSVIPDDKYLKWFYFIHMKKRLNLDNPRTFNEKMQWLKLYDRKPQYTRLVDKYEVRRYIADTIGEEYLIPLLGIWNKPEKIDFESLPDKFVLKCTHDSGSVLVCHNKKEFNTGKAIKFLNTRLKRNYFYHGREWPYKDVKPRIIAEQYMEEEAGEELKDYKLMCFNSKVKVAFVCSERYLGNGLRVTFFDTDWKRLPFERHYPASSVAIKKPEKYEEMIRIAEKLSEKLPFVRVDLYEIKGRIYFSELTFYPGSGIEEFNPEKWDLVLGKQLKLPI